MIVRSFIIFDVLVCDNHHLFLPSKTYNQNKQMYQVGPDQSLQPNIKHSKKLNSVKFFHFNSEWAHEYTEDSKPLPNPSHQVSSHTNRPTLQKPPKDDSTYSSSRKHFQHLYDSRFTNNVSETSQIYPKKKANSQLESYKKLQLSVLQSRFSRPTEDVSNQSNRHQKLKPEQQNDLIVNSTKLSALKLPEIRTTAHQNKNIRKIKLQNLRAINIQDRIKTMKFTPQKQPNQSFISEATTQLLKNKVKNISNLNKKFLEDRNRTEAVQPSIEEAQDHDHPTQTIFKVSKKRFKKEAFDENNSIHLKKFSKIQALKNPQNLHEQIKTSQNIQSQEDKGQKQSSLPKVYDKKMKIGRKKKSQEDRIRAILLKTLEKTRGTEYIAQQGSSQKKNTPRNSISQTKQSLSKEKAQPIKQRVSLILQNDKKIQESPQKKSSLKREQLQKLKKSLNPVNNKTDSRQPSNYIKNKKFVEMVRETENRRHKHEALQEIKEEKTITKEEHESESNSEDAKKMQRVAEGSSEVSENEFLPHSARLKLKQID